MGTRSRFSARGAELSSFDAVLVRTMPPGSLEQVVFRMDALGRLEAAGTPVINPPRAIECAVDKFLTTARLAEAGLPVPKTIVCQTVEQGLEAFTALSRDVVIKPLFGSEGRGIARLNDEAIAERALTLLGQLGGVLYLQEFIPHDGWDVRVFIVGKHVLAMRRTNTLDWRTNVSRGATAAAVELREEWVDLARRSAEVVGASVAGVDLLPGRDGKTYVIEVNAVPGWQATCRRARTRRGSDGARSRGPARWIMTQRATSSLNVTDRLDQIARVMPQAVAIAEPTRRVASGVRAYRTVTFRQLADDVERIVPRVGRLWSSSRNSPGADGSAEHRFRYAGLCADEGRGGANSD